MHRDFVLMSDSDAFIIVKMMVCIGIYTLDPAPMYFFMSNRHECIGISDLYPIPMHSVQNTIDYCIGMQDLALIPMHQGP